jgi:hypothetical protein
LSTETDKNDSLINEEKEMSIMLEVIPGVRKYPVKINADDEELIREATKQLRLKVNVYIQKFYVPDLFEEDLSLLDIMTMAAIDIATSHLRLERKNDMEPFVAKIQQLNDKLGNYLKEQ